LEPSDAVDGMQKEFFEPPDVVDGMFWASKKGVGRALMGSK